MASVVVDTHTIVWYLIDDPKLSKTAASLLDASTSIGDPIFVPSICLVEVTYLVEKGRLASETRNLLLQALDDAEQPARLVPMDRLIADAVARVSRTEWRTCLTGSLRPQRWRSDCRW